MSPDEQPTIFIPPPNGSRPASMGWQAPSVEEMQTMLPQYEIMEILGRGGMGAVYKGRQKSLKRLVAIKILPLDAADDEMKFVERFQNEAQTMAAMNHPAIVSVYDFGETPDGLLYFIMEFVDGTDVHKMIQASGKLSGEYALAITAHVCDALDYAHKRGVIHRDIKPANILIDQEGHIKVADFGLAKMHDPSQTSGLTKTNMAMGTPDYVAPEVLTTGMVADHRADLYAVGVMLYQMLTGEVPRGMFKLPSQKGIGSDPRFDEIICKAMEQDREERYQSAMEVRHALDVILTTPQPKDDGTGIVSASHIPQKPVAKQPRPPGERSQPPAQKPAPQKAPAQKAAAAPKAKAPPKKQSAATLWLSIGGIVTVLGLASFFALGGKSKPASRVQPLSASAVDAAFLAQVAAAPALRQVELVTQKIEALNGAKLNVEPTIKGEKVTGLRLGRAVGTEAMAPDVSPLAALKDLDSLRLEYLKVGDISCLRGLKLVNLTIWDGEFNDLSVLQSHPLQTLCLRGISVSDFSVLKGKALQDLDLELCDRLSDLSFIKGMPLKILRVPRTKVRDLSPIAGLPLTELVCDPEAKLDAALIASVPTLKNINLKPVSEWLSGSGNAPLSASQGKANDLLPLVDFNRAVAAAPPEEQVSLVTAKLNEINGAQADLVPTIAGGKVKFLRVARKGDALLPDISPLAALKDLTDLRLMYVGPADISCLGGLQLERLEVYGGTFEDISVLKSMPLRFLGLSSLSPNSQEAVDFTILRGMKLEMLQLGSKHLVDISFIKGMPLKDLSLTGSGVRDFSPIAGMPLSNLEFDPEAKPDMALLRSIPTLKTINKRPVSE
ncbi:MAG: protein kinase [Verrucomicrobiaceae bacterium]|nr:protein kinase [Verrucomicrobiaceae bacterium]